MADSEMAKISIVGKLTRVVDAEKITIDELAGNVASNDDRISIALVNAKADSAEPWLIHHYDQWICVQEGELKIEWEKNGEQTTVMIPAGEAVFIQSGTKFRPSFPNADTKYIPVCMPAFKPDRCERFDDDEEGKKIKENLKKLHGTENAEKTEFNDAGPFISKWGSSTRVVDAPDFKIDELVGNIASKNDRLSIAYVTAKAGASEPWLTLHYDEWICFLEGESTMEFDGGVVTAKGGETVLIRKGTRFLISFTKDTTYIPVCLPAFRPDRCIREDTEEEGRKVAENLNKIHGIEADYSEKLYHMLTKAEWEEAKSTGHAYFPKTYEEDGYYTHSTAVAPRLVDTANHYYQDVEGDWVCLEFTRTSLRRAGISVKDEEALPVGEQAISEQMKDWICPHIMGGIPPSVVDKEYIIQREGKRFVKIIGL